jgi:hypothetical protein
VKIDNKVWHYNKMDKDGDGADVDDEEDRVGFVAWKTKISIPKKNKSKIQSMEKPRSNL